MVFQNPDNQIVATIVEEDVAFALENLGVEPSEIRRRVDDALKTVDMYEYREHARITSYNVCYTKLLRLNLLIVYDVIFVAIAFMVFDFVVEE